MNIFRKFLIYYSRTPCINVDRIINNMLSKRTSATNVIFYCGNVSLKPLKLQNFNTCVMYFGQYSWDYFHAWMPCYNASKAIPIFLFLEKDSAGQSFQYFNLKIVCICTSFILPYCIILPFDAG